MQLRRAVSGETRRAMASHRFAGLHAAALFLLLIGCAASILGGDTTVAERLSKSHAPAAAPHPLSVPPSEALLEFHPADRGVLPPEWLEDRRGTGKRPYWVVSSDVCSSAEECRRSLQERVEELVSQELRRYFRVSPQTPVLLWPGDELWRKCVGPNVYHEVADTPLGPMHLMHARVILDPKMLDQFRTYVERGRQAMHLREVAFGAAGFYCAVALVWMGLRCYNLASGRKVR
ncbi:MAG: hypothetical protein KatS3mg110_2644 [Pirellulaceae bacterium]|nr:MAG: hypothetical protein KatS3mg110_2644 [Pirellulaceae bacterium]